MRVHREGKLHRAFSIFIFNSQGELLLQRRAKAKYHGGGLWANTACSHPRPGETYLQATHRRLREEMGFDCRLKKIFGFFYRAEFKNGLTENEYDCVFIGRFDGSPASNPAEVMDCRWMSLKDLRRDIASHPHKYAVWLKLALRKMRRKDLMDLR